MSKDFYKQSILPYAAIIIKICRAYTHSQEDFEDYYQEVCLQIWRSRNNFNQQSKWSTWVYRIALNVCLTLHKKKKPHFTSLDSKTKNQIRSEEKTISEHENIKLLYAAIKQLSEIDRAVILLYLEEKSYQGMAEILGISTTNIGVKINRIKKRLKKILNGKIN